ncbi:hypothetical protein C451_20672 [Halococcus thailandensis JCM 13552]|uniref:Type IV secretion system coupling protein TraD DNA-binding domain-containing protein n=2 Tax=Halococcus thailandensis TaxID=335952 RepID=M0MTX1_9EURY|nr:hypothetical protein C451_20672 [Halococcus thailandensis JCM 13552]
MLSYSPDDRDDAFDFRQYFDEDAVIIIDTGAVRDKSQSAMTLVILSMLWRALKRRKRESKLNTEQPLVNIYLDEASTVATSDMLGKMLAEGREFGCALILLTQYPEQFESDETEKDVAKEVYNNIGSIITSSVENDKRLAERLATDEESPQEIANRLGALNDGEWLLKLRSPYENRDPEMFIGRSQSLPPGHPDGDRQATEAELQTYENGYPATIDRAGEDAVSLDEPHPAESIQDGEELQRVDSALGLTQRLPDCVEYDEDRHAIKCESCQSHHDPNIDGMRRAINCCHDLDAVDRDDVPVCEINLKLTAEERAAAALTDRQLCFLQVVHDAQQGHHDPLEFDLIRDSMMRLKEYVDIDNEAVKELTNSDLMNRDTQPHLLYSVTADGRNVINETHRAGLDHGDGVGDLTESSQHIFAVEVARRYLEAAYVDNDESAVVEARPYYGVDDGHRLDLVGLDADGEIAVAVEVERSNPDRRSAAPADFDKIAATGCEDAIWVAMSRRKGHEILAALNDPDDGDPRVENTYSDGTPLSEVTIETEGLTDIYPVKHLRNTLDLEK